MNEIIARAIRGEASPAELAELAAWRTESSENEREYQESAAILKAIRTGAGHREFTPPSASDLLGRMRRRRAHESRRNGPAVWLPWAVAAAASITLAVQVSMSRTTAATASLDTVAQPAEIVTGAGELATVRLPDGSVARLAPRSRIRLVPTRHERTVWIEGQAFFAVAKNPARPFRVRTSEGDLVVLGTRFDVRTEPRGLRLAVIEGRVALLTRGERTEVNTGEAAGVRDGLPFPVVRFASSAEVTGWMRRFLAFQSTPLQSVAMEIERVYGRQIVIEDASLAGETVTATFTDESFEQVMRVVCTVVGVQCDITDSQVTISR